MYPYFYREYGISLSPMCSYCPMNTNCIYHSNLYSSEQFDTEYDSPYDNNEDKADLFTRFVKTRLYRENKSPRKSFTTEETVEIAKKLGIDFREFDVEQFRMGLDVELEHGRHNPATDVTGDDPILTGKIALAHLNEFPDYYTRLTKMENEAMEYWGTQEI